MRIWYAVIAGIIIFTGINITAPGASATSYKCFGAPADYVTAFDTVRGQAADGAVTYSQPRWYDEQQSWATPVGAFPGHHSEHVHFGACIPNARTITSAYPLDLSYTFHNMQDYIVTAASESAVSQNGSKSLWAATSSEIAELNAAAQASCPTCLNNIQHVYFSKTTLPPNTNGLKEIRGALNVSASGADAIFQTWQTDARWYQTDNYAGLASSSPLPNQLAIRVRPIVTFTKPVSSGGGVTTDYHHSGWSGASPQNTTTCGSVLTGTNSAVWGASFVSQPWSGDHTVCLYVTDGGGPATLMIDPDFHHHYTAPTSACPNIDANGNCLGVWYWKPANTREEIFSGSGAPQNIPVTIPGSILATLTPGLHRLVFKSDDFPECFRNSDAKQDWHLCPVDVRGTWTNVSVLPFNTP